MPQAQTPIWVINLLRSTSRRARISNQLSAGGFAYEIIDAIDGRTDNLPTWPRYDKKAAIRKKCWPLNGGQLGCFYSHVMLWQRCAKENQAVIILEDDALIYQENFRHFVDHCSALPESYGCVRLFAHNRQRYRVMSTQVSNDIEITLNNKGQITTTGYYLQPHAARALLGHVQDFFLPVDLYLDRFWQHGVPAHGVARACVAADPSCASDIRARGDVDEPQWRSARTSVLGKIRRESFRAAELVRRIAWLYAGTSVRFDAEIAREPAGMREHAPNKA